MEAHFAIALGLGKPAPVQLIGGIGLFPLFLQLYAEPLGFRSIMQDCIDSILHLHTQNNCISKFVQGTKSGRLQMITPTIFPEEGAKGL